MTDSPKFRKILTNIQYNVILLYVKTHSENSVKILLLVVVAIVTDVVVFLATGNTLAGMTGFIATLVGYVLPR